MIHTLFKKFDKNYTKLVNVILAFAFTSYLIGFVITNSYWGYFGFVNFDLLRVRYITVGILFLVFLSIITYIIYGLILVLREIIQQSYYKGLVKVLQYSVTQLLLVLIFLTAFLFTLSGALNIIPSGLSNLSPTISIDHWLFSSLVKIYKGIILYLTLLFILFSFLFLVWYNSEDLKKHPLRKRRLLAFKKSFGFSIFLFVTMTLLLMSFDFIMYIISGETRKIGGSNYFNGIYYFFISIIAIYFLAITFMSFPYMIAKNKRTIDQDEDTEDNSNKFQNVMGIIFLVVLFITFIFPMYTFRIYPEIPQQIGGGKLLEVEVITKSQSVNNILTKDNTLFYLLDQNSRNTFVAIVDTVDTYLQTISVSNDVIEYIIFPRRQLKDHKN